LKHFNWLKVCLLLREPNRRLVFSLAIDLVTICRFFAATLAYERTTEGEACHLSHGKAVSCLTAIFPPSKGRSNFYKRLIDKQFSRDLIYLTVESTKRTCPPSLTPAAQSWSDAVVDNSSSNDTWLSRRRPGCGLIIHPKLS
jgi:hypothetical protein